MPAWDRFAKMHVLDPPREGISIAFKGAARVARMSRLLRGKRRVTSSGGTAADARGMNRVFRS